MLRPPSVGMAERVRHGIERRPDTTGSTAFGLPDAPSGQGIFIGFRVLSHFSGIHLSE